MTIKWHGMICGLLVGVGCLLVRKVQDGGRQAAVAMGAGVAAHGGQLGFSYKEAPQLAAMVAAGGLAPVGKRLPKNPMIVQPVERIGVYGGTWRAGLLGNYDQNMFIRTIGYEHLVRWDPQWNKVIPNLAESFEVSADGREFTFRLRRGTRWSDGALFTAEDILFWYEDVFLVEEIGGLKPAWLMSGKEPVRVESLDLYTVRFSFKLPNGLFLQNLAHPRGAEITSFPKHYLKEAHVRYAPQKVQLRMKEVGATNWAPVFFYHYGRTYEGLNHWGNPAVPRLHAWLLQERYGEGERLVAVRNPYYWKIDPDGNQLPYLDRVVFVVGRDWADLLGMALRGELDVQDRHIGSPGNRELLERGREGGGYRFFDTIQAFGNVMVICLNLTHRDPVLRSIFQNRDFRIGLSHAIDRQEIIDRVYAGRGKPYQAAPRPESPFYHRRLGHQYTSHDVALANRYLDYTGCTARDKENFRLRPDGKRLTIRIEVADIYPDHIQGLELVRKHWGLIGVELQIQVEDRRTQIQNLVANGHDGLAWLGNGGLDVVLDPIYYYPFNYDSSYAVNWVQWEPEDYPRETAPAVVMEQDRLYRALQESSNPAEQARIMYQILDIAAEQFYVIGIARPENGYGIVNRAFRNVPPLMPAAWTYPHPAPNNPCQYFTTAFYNSVEGISRPGVGFDGRRLTFRAER